MRIKPFLFLSVTALFFMACSPKEKTSKNIFDNADQYREYITELSHGIISAKSDVRVVLTSPVNSWNTGDELPEEFFSVSPKVAGKVVALDTRTIAFVPQDRFEQNKAYKFTLALGTIVPDVPKELRSFSFGLRTMEQQFNVYTNAIQSYSRELQYIEGQLKSADELPLAVVKKLIQVKQKGKPVSLRFDETIEEGTQFQFKIDSIERFEEDTALEVSWDGTPFGIENSGKHQIDIPGKNNFTVLEAMVKTGTEQQISVNFSDPLKKGQNFKGLVVLEGDDDLKFTVKGNTLKVYPSKTIKGLINLEIFEGIQSVEDYKLKEKYVERIAFEQLKPQLRMLTNGTILPSSNNLKINFEAVNLKAVDVSVLRIYENNVLQFLQGNNLNGTYNLKSVARPIATKKIVLQNNLSSNTGKWTAHALDLRTLISPEMGAMYRVELNYRPMYGLYQCNTVNFGQETEEENYDTENETSFWDGSENYYSDYYEGYDWNERENPCHTSYYVNKKVGVNILASDIGVSVKKGVNNSYFIAVNDIVGTDPVPNAKITFYNFQQQALGDVLTDTDGTAIYDADHLAYFAIVEHRGQKTYIKLNDGNALSVSKFNVSGIQLKKGMKGFIFGERGVWRPGDQLFLSFMLNDKANTLPEGHPVKLELIDPYNKVVHREIKTNGLNNFYDFTIKTNENAPTGNWLAKISVGGASFTKTLKIETIKPNRLRIKTGFEDEILSASKPIAGTLDVQWLHGAIAKNLKVDITSKFRSQTTSFKTFPGYVFDDPSRSFSVEDQVVFNGIVDEKGKADFSIAPSLEGVAPGMLKAAFITKVYENGGDFSTDVFTKTYSPYATYVGLNVPKGDKTRGMLLTDTPHGFEVVTVDDTGKPKAVKGIKVSIHKINWRWWWDTSEDNLSSYNGGQYREKVFEKTIHTNAQGKGSFNFELKYPNWGRYLVRVEDSEGGHATGKVMYIDWPGWAGKSRKSDPSAATMLVFSTDKETYSVGETATVTFPSSEGGRALVTIENGSEVLQSLWVETRQGETKFQFPVTDLYTPNVYISISLLQPHASTANDAPIRLYGVVPIGVENSETKLQPEITMPEVLVPEENITIKVKEKQGKAMTYSIAIVDEGLLDLTRFKTPDPWGAFYAHEALGVKTWDVYDDVIGAFGGRIDQVFAIGGDGEIAGAKNKKANRFEPMVVHLGPFSLKEGGTGTHHVKIPKYIGSVRTMVIAGDAEKEAYGTAVKTTPVRKPLMVLASLPRKMTPGEKVTLPVTVFAMEKKVKNVTLTLKEDQSFTIEGNRTQQLSFSQPDEKMAYFTLNVTDVKGIGKIVVEARGNGESASFEIPIDVVNPNPLTSTVQGIVLAGKGTQNMSLETFGAIGSNIAQVEFSTLPPMNFNGRMKYLIRYPHGCVEQTTSAAFPQLFLTRIFDMEESKKRKIQGNVMNAISRLGSFQLVNGGFSYWPGQNSTDDWGTTYAGHFLLEAEKKGYVLPIGFKSNWVKYQRNAAKQWRSTSKGSDLAQAYRLYTLALSGNAELASMNRLRETSSLSNEAKFRLAAAYGHIGQTAVARELLSDAVLDFDSPKQYYGTYGSSDRNRAMALETYAIMKDRTKSQQMAKMVAQRLSGNHWMSTQSTSYGLLAMAKFADLVGGKGIKAKISLRGNTERISTTMTLAERELDIVKGTNNITISNETNHTLYVRIINSGILPVGAEKEVQRNLEVKRSFKGRNGTPLDIAAISQGTDFIAEVTLKNTTGNPLKNVALTEIFPSGWEIVNTRFTDFGDFAQNEVSHTDLRDDRANFYFDMKKGESKTFRILLNASYLGRYYLPGIQAEAMYDNDYLVRTKGQWINVVQ